MMINILIDFDRSLIRELFDRGVIKWNMESGNWSDDGQAWESEIEIGALVDLFIARTRSSFFSLFNSIFLTL